MGLPTQKWRYSMTAGKLHMKIRSWSEYAASVQISPQIAKHAHLQLWWTESHVINAENWSTDKVPPRPMIDHLLTVGRESHTKTGPMTLTPKSPSASLLVPRKTHAWWQPESSTKYLHNFVIIPIRVILPALHVCREHILPLSVVW